MAAQLYMTGTKANRSAEHKIPIDALSPLQHALGLFVRVAFAAPRASSKNSHIVKYSIYILASGDNRGLIILDKSFVDSRCSSIVALPFPSTMPVGIEVEALMMC